MTVSFYIVNNALDSPDLSDNKVRSTIKFGSMDTINLGYKPSRTIMFMYRTKNKTTWNLRSKDFVFDKTEIGGESEVSFEPQLPYIYLPFSYYTTFSQKLNKYY